MYKIILLGIAALMAGVLWSVAGGENDFESAHQPKTMPLVPMMQLLLEDMQQMDAGIYTADFKLIEHSSARIVNHPVMTEDDKRLVQNTLGKDMKEFVSKDRLVHHHSDSIRLAALAGDMVEVLRHYRIVQEGCVSCHSSFRSQIVKARE